MSDNYFEIQYFYGGHSSRTGYKGRLMRAVDVGGLTFWKKLSPQAKKLLNDCATAAFTPAPDGPHGDADIKHVFLVSSYYPQGHLEVGRWWDLHANAEHYFQRRGFSVMEVRVRARSPESGRVRKEAR